VRCAVNFGRSSPGYLGGASFVLVAQSHSCGSLNQINDIIDAQLSHNMAAMHFNSAFGTLQNIGYPFIAYSFENQAKHNSFGSRKRLASQRVIACRFFQELINSEIFRIYIVKNR